MTKAEKSAEIERLKVERTSREEILEKKLHAAEAKVGLLAYSQQRLSPHTRYPNVCTRPSCNCSSSLHWLRKKLLLREGMETQSLMRSCRNCLNRKATVTKARCVSLPLSKLLPHGSSPKHMRMANNLQTTTITMEPVGCMHPDHRASLSLRSDRLTSVLVVSSPRCAGVIRLRRAQVTGNWNIIVLERVDMFRAGREIRYC